MFDVECEGGVVPFEVPLKEQVRLFCTTLDPFPNQHCLLFSGPKRFFSVQCSISIYSRNVHNTKDAFIRLNPIQYNLAK